jgi:hypothetical protein
MDNKKQALMKPGMVDGTVITLGGQDYVCPPLNLKNCRLLSEELDSLQRVRGILKPEDVDTVCKIALAALQRNYPSMTLEEVEEKIDLGNFSSVILSVLKTSGVEEKKQGEAVAIP